MPVNKVVYNGETVIDISDETVTAADVKETATFYEKDGTKSSGGMAVNSPTNTTITSASQSVTIPAGFHDGTGTVSIAAAEKSKLIPGNIKRNTTILGVSGKSSVVDVSNSTVTPDKMLSTAKAYNSAGTLISGEITTYSNTDAVTVTFNDNAMQRVTIPRGFHDGTSSVVVYVAVNN